MNKILKKRLVASILLLSMVISIPTVRVSALTETKEGTEDTKTTEDIINQTEGKVEIIPDSKLPLYNMEDEVTAYYYKLETGGYAITNVEDGIIEFHFTDDIYNLTKEDKFYYTAPLECYEDVGNKKVKHRFDKKTRRKDSFSMPKGAGEEYNWKNKRENEVTSAELSKYTNVEKGGITGHTSAYKMTFGATNICASIAAAILFKYYDDEENEKYIAASYETEEKLIKLLVPYINPIEGAYYPRLKSGMVDYLSDRGLSSKKIGYIIKENSLNVYNQVKLYTKTKNRPVIVGLSYNSSYTSHWVVGTGYWTVKITANNASTTARYIQMNDGWGHTGVYINLRWTDGVLYIK